MGGKPIKDRIKINVSMGILLAMDFIFFIFNIIIKLLLTMKYVNVYKIEFINDVSEEMIIQELFRILEVERKENTFLDLNGNQMNKIILNEMEKISILYSPK